MAFSRAEWHSGLTYVQTCRNCNCTVQYTDYSLDFRPWYADGFVYCPRCNTPLRHNENYAVNNPNKPVSATPPTVAKFCTQCGEPFRDEDQFCSQCGKKR